ncbi:MAG: hypothetical protein AAF682_30740 [Planctomycetota bacterium]
MAERDPLDDLRAAWERLEPAETGGDLEAEDDATRAAVGWLQAAWSELGPGAEMRSPTAMSPTPTPTATPAPASASAEMPAGWRALAAAAAVLVLFGALALLARPGGGPPGFEVARSEGSSPGSTAEPSDPAGTGDPADTRDPGAARDPGVERGPGEARDPGEASDPGEARGPGEAAEPGATAAGPESDPEAPEVAFVDAGRIEVRAGNVRLVLVTESDARAGEAVDATKAEEARSER